MNASKPDQQGILPRDLFAGKTVFVTGGGSGINLGIARTFAGLGAKIGICGRSQERLDAAAAGLRELGAKVSATSADVRMPDQLQSAMNASRDTLGDIDVLVCGAAGNFLVKGENLSFNGFKTIVDARIYTLRDRADGNDATCLPGPCRTGKGRGRDADEKPRA